MTDFPTLDPELAAIAATLPELDVSDLTAARAVDAELSAPGRSEQSYEGIEVRIVEAPGPAGAPVVPIRLLRPQGAVEPLPVLVAIHGGGFVLGSALAFDDFCLDVVRALGIAVANVDYRLAPETPFPGPLDDCYAALNHVHDHAAELGLDPTRIAVCGSSAGGGLAAATALRARDEGRISLVFQVLVSPAVDDRVDTPSMTAFVDTPVLKRRDAVLCWRYYTGTEPGSPDTSPYAAPLRADDLSDLPPCYLVAMELDPLRDANIEYALQLLQAGVSVELHSFPGAFHGALELAPQAAVSVRAQRELMDALRRGLGLAEPSA